MSNNDEATSELIGQIDAVLAFASVIETRSPGNWEGGEKRQDGTITMPWFDYDEYILAFIRACGQNGWIEVFAWPEWQPEALEYYEFPETLADADLVTIRKLLTLHIRKDRFSEGHLAAMVEAGHISAILARLAEIRRTIEVS